MAGPAHTGEHRDRPRAHSGRSAVPGTFPRTRHQRSSDQTHSLHIAALVSNVRQTLVCRNLPESLVPETCGKLKFTGQSITVTAKEYAEQVEKELKDSWLPQIYRERILKMRTRSYHFGSLKPKPRVEIQHTLLGIELKAGRRRLLCPDLATARYLAVFARASCQDVAVPYDITRISRLADELESSWHRMLLLANHYAVGRNEAFTNRISGLLVDKLRAEISEAGAGTPVPEFKKSTKQRV